MFGYVIYFRNILKLSEIILKLSED